MTENENNVTEATNNNVTRVTKYRLSRFWDPWPDWREKLYLGYNDLNHLDCVIEENRALLMDSEADAISWQKFVRESEKWFIEEVEIEVKEEDVLPVQVEEKESQQEEAESQQS
jgi:hypothetical protein